MDRVAEDEPPEGERADEDQDPEVARRVDGLHRHVRPPGEGGAGERRERELRVATLLRRLATARRDQD
eukprot:6373088-Heterocapsa_arctica.AAC.1